MKKILLALLLIFGFCGHLHAWNLADHRNLSRLALEDVASGWGLDHPIEVKPIESLLEKLRPLREELGDSWHLAQFLQINTKTDFSSTASYRFESPLTKQKTLTPLEILFLYSTDPDDGRDQDLLMRDATGRARPAYPDQKWFGVVTGPNSQAFRHIEKPPFSLSHPLRTFGLPFRSVGEASKRAEIYFQTSRLAFALGEDYWGWRFLAHAFHYLEDLHQPYHSGQITPSLLKKGLRGLSWGMKSKGLMGTFATVVANSHRFFESYVDKVNGDNTVRKEKALNAVKGIDLAPWNGSALDLARQARDASNLVYGELSEAVSKIADPRLDGPYEFQSDDANPDNPQDFVTTGPDFAKANDRIFEIVQDRFASTGRTLRTTVDQVLKNKKTDTAESAPQILSNLETLLGPNPLISPDQEPN